MNDRANIFDEAEDEGRDPGNVIDLSGIAKGPRTPRLDRAEARAAANATGFSDRSAPRQTPADDEDDGRYRTGRDQQINLKVTTETKALFRRLCQGQKKVEVFEEAVIALARNRGLIE